MIRRSTSLPAALVVALGLVNASPPVAQAQEAEALAKVKDFNKKAIEAYENLDIEEARKFLMQALEVCAAEGLNKHPLKAATHVNLGVVLIGGLKQREAGIKQFRRAIEIEPGVKVAKRLSNPEIQSAFEAAAKEAATGEPVANEAEKPEAPKPEPVKAEPTPEPEKPATPAAADKGAGGVKGIFHEPVTEAKPGEPIPVKAKVEAGLSFERLVLAYRPEGATDFLARDMEKDESGWYTARIPEPATGGNSVHYYIEARARGGAAVATNGSSAEPHQIALGEAAAVAQKNSGENPDVSEEVERPSSSAAGQYWVGIGIGGGGGYAKGNAEVTPKYLDRAGATQANSFAGVAGAQLMHLSPEIGYFLSPTMIVSLQGRLQLVTGATEVHHMDCMPSGTCTPAKGAIAVLGKVTWLMEPMGSLRPWFALAAGGGQIRYLINLGSRFKDCGPAGNAACVDTVAGGSVLLGPSAGVTYPLSSTLFFTGGVNALLGVPKTAFNVDLNLGLGLKI